MKSSTFFARNLILLACFVACFNASPGQSPASNAAPIHPTAPPPRPPPEPPTFADVAYGPDLKQKLDIYLPPGPGPFPVIFFIHGGGWFGGDKKAAPSAYTKNGAAVISINYRLIDDAVKENISPPIVAVLGDTRRALQFVRLHAADYRLDPDKIVTNGSSAGALSSLYLACEGEQANPNSPDPVERVSTRILAAAAGAAQTSVDPRQIREWNPGVAWGYWAFEPDGHNYGSMPDFERYLANRDKWLPYIQKYSADILMTKDTPPIYLNFGQPLPKPDEHPTIGQLVHSPLWGVGFQKLAQERGVTCYLEFPGHPCEKYKNADLFLFTELGLAKK